MCERNLYTDRSRPERAPKERIDYDTIFSLLCNKRCRYLRFQPVEYHFDRNSVLDCKVRTRRCPLHIALANLAPPFADRIAPDGSLSDSAQALRPTCAKRMAPARCLPKPRR